MAVCNRISFEKPKICTGDLRHRISLYERRMTNPSFNELVGSEEFILISDLWSAVKTFAKTTVSTSGTKRFNGVNIDPNTTHLFVIRYNVNYDGLEHGNNFVGFKSRYYRVDSTANLNEDDEWILIQCSERGDDTKEATRA